MFSFFWPSDVLGWSEGLLGCLEWLGVIKGQLSTIKGPGCSSICTEHHLSLRAAGERKEICAPLLVLSSRCCEFQSKCKLESWQFSAQSSSARRDLFSPPRGTDITQVLRPVWHSETSQWIATADTLCTWCSCTAPSGRLIWTPCLQEWTAHQCTLLTPSSVLQPGVSKHFFFFFTWLDIKYVKYWIWEFHLRVLCPPDTLVGALSVLSDPPSLQPCKCQNAYSALKALSVLCDRVCILDPQTSSLPWGFNTHPVLFNPPTRMFWHLSRNLACP